MSDDEIDSDANRGSGQRTEVGNDESTWIENSSIGGELTEVDLPDRFLGDHTVMGWRYLDLFLDEQFDSGRPDVKGGPPLRYQEFEGRNPGR